MKSFLISTALALLASQIHASPTPANIEARQFAAQVTFQGAPPDAAFYTLSIPADGREIAISRPQPSSFLLFLLLPLVKALSTGSNRPHSQPFEYLAY